MYSKTERNILAVLEQAGYCSNKKVTDTLQGSIWSSTHRQTKESVIIKVTSRKLHKESMIIYDGKKYTVDENIIKEKEILKYLTTKVLSSSPSSSSRSSLSSSSASAHFPSSSSSSPVDAAASDNIVAYREFFKSNSNYYFVMENGGHMLFDFVVRVHRYIESKKLEIAEWHRFVKIIFREILRAVAYIHTQNVCHFDISLENLLINDVEVELDDNGKIKFCAENIKIKICDFGLSEQFISNNFQSTKYCGKPNYRSPECTNKESFDAKKNDIWCVGVCLFMLLIGGNMVSTASVSDKSFKQIMNGEMEQMLRKWNRIQYVNSDILHLFNQIFVYESQRVTLHGIQQHTWLKARNAN